MAPIIDARAVLRADIVVFANYTQILAYAGAGLKWRTGRLSWDGLKIVTIGDRTLVGTYWDIREDAEMQFEVDLATGAARGGVASP